MIRPTRLLCSTLVFLAITGAAAPVSAQGLDLPSVFLEELTWTEVRDAIDSGTTTIIIPTAGNGAERTSHGPG